MSWVEIPKYIIYTYIPMSNIFSLFAKFHMIISPKMATKLVLAQTQKYRKNRNFLFLVPKILSSLGSSHFRFRYQSFRFHLTWSRNGAQMEPNWIRTSSKMRKTQIIPCKPCTGTLVLSSENQNRGTRSGTVEPQELRLQYQNRD